MGRLKSKLPRFSQPDKPYNAYCTHPGCGWRGVSPKLITDKVLPDQCSRCHNRGKLRVHNL